MKQKAINKCLEIAFALSLKNTLRCRHYAFVLNGNKILSIGENKTHRHPTQDFWGYNEMCSEHAEYNALRKLGEIDCRRFSFLTFRIDRNNVINNGQPCSSCENFLRHFGFKEIVYSTEKGEWKNYE